MEPSESQRAVEAARATASELGLQVHDAIVVHNSNRVAVRLVPCDVLARVAPPEREMAVAELEVEVARRLADSGSPVAEPAPRVQPGVYVHGGFSVTLWTYYEPLPSSELSPADYAQALARLHAGLRQLDLRTPHVTDRVADAQKLIADREHTPGLPDADRELLSNALCRLSPAISGRGRGDQMLHGEPHPANLLRTRKGLLFIDFETCCRGPVEFDIAHGLLSDGGRPFTAEEVCEHYPASDQHRIEQCRILIWAMITTWRWDRDDELPNGRYWALEGLNQLRQALVRYGLDASGSGL